MRHNIFAELRLSPEGTQFQKNFSAKWNFWGTGISATVIDRRYNKGCNGCRVQMGQCAKPLSSITSG
jgi:hypothetical protein